MPKKRIHLRKPQLRILEFLETITVGYANHILICEEARVDPAWLPDSLYGRLDPEERIKREKKIGYKSLFSLGLVECTGPVDIVGKKELLWSITDKGKEYLRSLKQS